jgi:hypothetical protein
MAPVIFDQSGRLYGTTVLGGTANCGIAFRLTSNQAGGWNESVLHTFLGVTAQDGENPNGLIFDTHGNLYGTSLGGALTTREPFLRFRRCPMDPGPKRCCIASRPGWTERILRRVWRWMRPAISMARRFGAGLPETLPEAWRSSTHRKSAHLEAGGTVKRSSPYHALRSQWPRLDPRAQLVQAGDCGATLPHLLDEMLADSGREIIQISIRGISVENQTPKPIAQALHFLWVCRGSKAPRQIEELLFFFRS